MLFHIFVHYLKADGEPERFIYTIRQSDVADIVKDYNKQRTFNVKPVDTEVEGMVATFPVDRVVMLEFLPIDKSPVTKLLQQQQQKALEAQKAAEAAAQAEESATAEAIEKLLAAKAEVEQDAATVS